jgi:hypothetical protein
MSTRPTPRVRVPGTVKAGEVVEVKTLISHEMESGQRRGSDGKPAQDHQPLHCHLQRQAGFRG